ncbi:MAG: GAF domain-containing sensor histidine kinase [Actinobacteria bacterium]|nr:GAF domain-containing sensor histidine kinase [Actinomycetota bacterium]
MAALVTDATGTDVCFVHLVDEERGRLTLAGATPPFDELAGTIELAVGEGIAGWVARHGVPAVVDDKWSDTRYKYIPALRGEDFASLVSLPMIRRARRVVGVVNLHSRRPWTCPPEELAVLTDVTGLLAGVVENARLYHRLAAREAELERFASRTIELQELERRRVAAEIHDGISQPLVSLWYRLSAAQAANPEYPEVVASQLTAAQELTTAALEEARRTIVGLRPAVLDDLGLGAGIESLAHSLAAGGVHVQVEVEQCELAPHVETAIFRITQESLQNVAKHAEATHVRVELSTTAGGARLVVADDGAGFDPERIGSERRADSFGLAGIHERAALVGATVRIASRPGEGTTVSVFVPREPRS